MSGRFIVFVFGITAFLIAFYDLGKIGFGVELVCAVECLLSRKRGTDTNDEERYNCYGLERNRFEKVHIHIGMFCYCIGYNGSAKVTFFFHTCNILR